MRAAPTHPVYLRIPQPIFEKLERIQELEIRSTGKDLPITRVILALLEKGLENDAPEHGVHLEAKA